MWACTLSHVQLFVTLWTITHQAPLSTEFFRQEYWRGLPFPSPGNLPEPKIEPGSPAMQAGSLPTEPPGNSMSHLNHPKQPSPLLFLPLPPPVQFSSVAQSCLTLCDPMGCSRPGLPVHHQLPEFTQTHDR